MTKTERNKLRKEEKRKGTVLVTLLQWNPMVKRTTSMLRRVKTENVKAY